jgi:hypothetical protein
VTACSLTSHCRPSCRSDVGHYLGRYAVRRWYVFLAFLVSYDYCFKQPSSQYAHTSFAAPADLATNVGMIIPRMVRGKRLAVEGLEVRYLYLLTLRTIPLILGIDSAWTNPRGSNTPPKSNLFRYGSQEISSCIRRAITNLHHASAFQH